MTYPLLSFGALLWVTLSLAFGTNSSTIYAFFTGEEIVTPHMQATKAHADLSLRVEAIIAGSRDGKQALSRLAEWNWSDRDRVLAVSAATNEQAPREIYARSAWTASSNLSKHGIGFGVMVTHRGTQEFFLLEGSATTRLGEKITYAIHVKHQDPLPEG